MIDPWKHPYYAQLLPKTKEAAEAWIAEKGQDVVDKAIYDIQERIKREFADPFKHGIELKHWSAVDQLWDIGASEILLSGGNRSSKTEYAAKQVIKRMLAKPNARIWCFHTTHQSSLQVQQPVVWKYMPLEYKNQKVRRGHVSYIKYDQRNGFGKDNTFIFPNGAQCTFMHYSQAPDVWEGAELDFCWMDELVPVNVLETMRYRLATRQGKLLVTFTPIEGYTMTVKDFIQGGKVIQSKPSELLPGHNVDGLPEGHMPFLMRCRRPRTYAVWFHTKWNPYNKYEELKRILKGASNEEIKIRAYGWADNAIGNAFPRFNEDVHVIPHEKIPTEGANLFVLDPAGSRNWFMIWARVYQGKVYVYREWPDRSIGEWAVPGEKPDGKPGPAQKSGAGRSVAVYKQMINEMESEEVWLRLIDPRAAGTATSTGKTLLEELETNHPDVGGMYFTPASGKDIKDGVELINNLLYYDRNQPLSDENEPSLFVSDKCQNLAWCLKEWTGADGQKGATKDPVDATRYLVLEDPLNLAPTGMQTFGGGSY